jgi:hypothetical protein
MRLRQKTLARYYRRIAKAVYVVVKNSNRIGKKSIPKRSLYERFTSFGHRNFLSYVTRAARSLRSSSVLDKQISGHKSVKFLKKKLSKNITKLNGKKI